MTHVVSKLSNYRQQMVGFFAAIGTFLIPLQANAASIESTAKGTGSKVVILLLTLALIVAAVTFAVGVGAFAFNISWLQQVATKKMFIAAGAIILALMALPIYTFVVNAVTGSGGSFRSWQWPF